MSQLWLVCVDESVLSDYAFSFAKRCLSKGDHLFLLCVAEQPAHHWQAWLDLEGFKERQAAQIQRVLAHYDSECGKNDIPCTMIMAYGNHIADVVFSLSETLKINHIVLGRSSSSRYVVEHAPCNVIVTKQPIDGHTVDRETLCDMFNKYSIETERIVEIIDKERELKRVLSGKYKDHNLYIFRENGSLILHEVNVTQLQKEKEEKHREEREGKHREEREEKHREEREGKHKEEREGKHKEEREGKHKEEREGKHKEERVREGDRTKEGKMKPKIHKEMGKRGEAERRESEGKRETERRESEGKRETERRESEGKRGEAERSGGKRWEAERRESEGKRETERRESEGKIKTERREGEGKRGETESEGKRETERRESEGKIKTERIEGEGKRGETEGERAKEPKSMDAQREEETVPLLQAGQVVE